jgi:hypothetical protein|tara:strand:- start:2014 stop:2187 length:174 start_codon:yes stop_codon:yes gene_type:complete
MNMSAHLPPCFTVHYGGLFICFTHIFPTQDFIHCPETATTDILCIKTAFANAGAGSK